SDLDGVADYLTFILKGEMVFSKECEEIRESYRIIRGDEETLEKLNIEFLSLIHKPYYSEGLFIKGKYEIENSYIATIEDIMFHYARGSKND
ncbi:MAG: ABC transporter ATP-binding protein, partial [Clostridium sp.]